MKATINHEALQKELKKMSFVIKKNTVLPILTSVLFQFDKNKLTITGTDLETTYISTLDCDCSKPFSTPIEYSKIIDICTNVSAPITLEVKDKEISIVSGKWKGKLSKYAESEHYPLVPTDNFDFSFNVDGDFFFALSNANTCRSKEDLKVNLNMAAMDVKKDSVTVVGTDANYLYKKTLPIKSKKELKVMVCDMFVQSCKSFQESTVSIGEKFIKVEHGNETIISRLSDNNFVDYTVIIPKEINYNVTVQKDELKSVLRSITVTANITSNQCVLSFNGVVKATSQNIDFGEESESEIDLQHSVEINAIACNMNQLTHLLNLIEGNAVEMAITAPNKTIYLRPAKDNETLLLLQPLMIAIPQNN